MQSTAFAMAGRAIATAIARGVPAIYVIRAGGLQCKTWMPATSAGMTE
jgi:hypothetical protein